MNDSVRWLAGLLEGEGSFYTCAPKVKGKYYPYPTIRVRMTDREPIERVSRFFGSTCGQLKDLPSGKPLFQTAACSLTAAGWMMTLWADMSPRRRAQIKTALSRWQRRLWTGPAVL